MTRPGEYSWVRPCDYPMSLCPTVLMRKARTLNLVGNRYDHGRGVNSFKISSQATNIFTTVGRLMARPSWLKQRELLNYVRVPVWTLGLSNLWSDGFRPMVDAILRIWRKSGSTFVVEYLKSCRLAVVAALAGNKWEGSIPSIKTSRSGLPLIIPSILRVYILQYIRTKDVDLVGFMVVKAVLTVLSVYRVIGCHPNPKIETITSPFSGTAQVLASEEILRVVKLIITPLIVKPANPLFINEAAGPNFNRSTWGSGLDALAFLFHPWTWVNWAYICCRSGNFKLLLWQMLVVLVSVPLWPLAVGHRLGLWIQYKLGIGFPVKRGPHPFFLKGPWPLKLGKLVKLYEGAGKVRIVAVTDWWTQCLLKPLHEGLFNILREIPQDGTFDQHAPAVSLHEHIKSNGFVASYDLSAATDRLPVAFQAQVLSALGLSWAHAWMRLLVDRAWYLDGKKLFYAVGQPIGAYSSWAILAISHHILVQIAAGRVGWVTWFPYYAIIGDDVVIADKAVATAYLALMDYLGVTINLGKSVVSEHMYEFAKKLVSVHGDLSPFGAGVILVAIRDIRMFGLYIRDMTNKGIMFNMPEQLTGITSVLNLIRRKVGEVPALVMLMVLGPTGGLWQGGQSSSFLDSWVRTLTTKHSTAVAVGMIRRFYRQFVLNAATMADIQSVRDYTRFEETWWKYSTLGPSTFYGLLSALLVFVSPALWSYILLQRIRFAEVYEENMGRFNQWAVRRSRSLNIEELDRSDEIRDILLSEIGLELSSIPFMERQKVLQMFMTQKALKASFDRPPYVRKSRRTTALVNTDSEGTTPEGG